MSWNCAEAGSREIRTTSSKVFPPVADVSGAYAQSCQGKVAQTSRVASSTAAAEIAGLTFWLDLAIALTSQNCWLLPRSRNSTATTRKVRPPLVSVSHPGRKKPVSAIAVAACSVVHTAKPLCGRSTSPMLGGLAKLSSRAGTIVQAPSNGNNPQVTSRLCHEKRSGNIGHHADTGSGPILTSWLYHRIAC